MIHRNESLLVRSESFCIAVLICLFISTLISCIKEESKPPIPHHEMLLCHDDSIWDKNEIRNRLIGIWQWEYISCPWEIPGYVLDSNIVIQFQLDSSLVVRQNDQIKMTSIWRVVDDKPGYYGIDVEPYLNMVYGRVIFCDDRMSVDQTSVEDGCVNYFIRN